MKDPKTPFAARVLDNICAISMMVFFVSLFLKVWADESEQWFINNMIISSVISFAGSLIIYGFYYYESEDDKNE
jgi:hypothetical protein